MNFYRDMKILVDLISFNIFFMFATSFLNICCIANDAKLRSASAPINQTDNKLLDQNLKNFVKLSFLLT